MEANGDRVAAALSGSVLRASGADLVLAEWRDPGGGTVGEDTVEATEAAR